MVPAIINGACSLAASQAYVLMAVRIPKTYLTPFEAPSVPFALPYLVKLIVSYNYFTAAAQYSVTATVLPDGQRIMMYEIFLVDPLTYVNSTDSNVDQRSPAHSRST